MHLRYSKSENLMETYQSAIDDWRAALRVTSRTCSTTAIMILQLYTHGQGKLFGSTSQIPLNNDNEDESQVPGYTTTDDAGKDGDDTIHKPIKFYSVPNCVAAEIGFSSSKDEKKPDNVDIVYNQFIQDWILLALEYQGLSYGEENTQVALEGKSMTGVIKDWVAENWFCKDEK